MSVKRSFYMDLHITALICQRRPSLRSVVGAHSLSVKVELKILPQDLAVPLPLPAAAPNLDDNLMNPFEILYDSDSDDSDSDGDDE